MPDKPLLRLIHHLPRSGGTIICKCMGSLPGVVLLSEINPLRPLDRTPQLEPVFQASFWFRLFNHETATQLLDSDASFADKIQFIAERATERGEALLIRDWMYIDFFGKPYRPTPTYRLSLVDTLAEHFDIRQLFTVRHPLDQWLSWCHYLHAPYTWSLEDFMRACRKFADTVPSAAFVRYEDFVTKPNAVMQKACDMLDLPFDPVYANRWRFYRTISGDIEGSRADSQIRSLPRRSYDAALLDQLWANEDYRATLALLGYHHVETKPTLAN